MLCVLGSWFRSTHCVPRTHHSVVGSRCENSYNFWKLWRSSRPSYVGIWESYMEEVGLEGWARWGLSLRRGRGSERVGGVWGRAPKQREWCLRAWALGSGGPVPSSSLRTFEGHHASFADVRLLHHPADSVTGISWNTFSPVWHEESKSSYLIALSQGWDGACKERSLLVTGRFSLRVLLGSSFVMQGWAPTVWQGLCGPPAVNGTDVASCRTASVVVCGGDGEYEK